MTKKQYWADWTFSNLGKRSFGGKFPLESYSKLSREYSFYDDPRNSFISNTSNCQKLLSNESDKEHFKNTDVDLYDKT